MCYICESDERYQICRTSHVIRTIRPPGLRHVGSLSTSVGEESKSIRGDGPLQTADQFVSRLLISRNKIIA